MPAGRGLTGPKHSRSGMERMPLVLRPRDLEPGHGVFVRLAARNGYDDVRLFAKAHCISYRKILTGHRADQIAMMAGLKPVMVQRCSPVMLPRRKVLICGETVNLGDWSTSRRRFCPKCLQVDRHVAQTIGIEDRAYASHRTIWDISSVLGCPSHRIKLRNRCHRCEAALGWHSPDMLVCPICHVDLASAPIEPVDDPIGRYVYSRLCGKRTMDAPILDRLPPWSAIKLCERLGQITTIGYAKSIPSQTQESVFLARSIGIGMCRNLKNAVVSSLDNLLVSSGTRALGLYPTYGWVYGEWLAKEDASNGQLRKILFDHAVRNEIISANEPVLGNNPPRSLSMTAAAKILGVGYDTAYDLLKSRRAIPAAARRGVAFTVDPNIVEEVKVETAKPGGISLAHAAALLKTGKMQVADLIRAKLLMPSNCEAIAPRSLTVMLEKLEAVCVGAASSPRHTALGVAARDTAVPLHRIIEAIQLGALECYLGRGTGLARFYTDKLNVINLRPVRKRVSVEEAAHRIGVHSDCARALARAGAITNDRGCITSRAISRFEGEFIAGSRLARTLHKSPRSVHLQLRAVGIYPAFDIKKFRQIIYRQSELSDLPSLVRDSREERTLAIARRSHQASTGCKASRSRAR